MDTKMSKTIQVSRIDSSPSTSLTSQTVSQFETATNEQEEQSFIGLAMHQKTMLYPACGLGFLILIVYLTQIFLPSPAKWFHIALWILLLAGGKQLYIHQQEQAMIDQQINKMFKDLSEHTQQQTGKSKAEKKDQGKENQSNKINGESSIKQERTCDIQESATKRSLSPELHSQSFKVQEPVSAQKESIHQIQKKITQLASDLQERDEMDKRSNRSIKARAEKEFSVKDPQKSKPITRLCITGGPCSGKTTALFELQGVLQELGFRVLIVPDAASVMNEGGGLLIKDKTKFLDAVKFQTNLMRSQMNLEDIFIDIASTSKEKHTIIICDGGTMDGAAYTEEHVWQAILDETGWSTIQLRDRRYEAVIHLSTAADGAEEFYQGQETDGKIESAEEARKIDQMLINAWVGHPQFNIVKNTKKGFKMKIQYCIKRCLAVIGMPRPSSMNKKFLLACDGKGLEDLVPQDIKCEVFKVEETFIHSAVVGQSSMLLKIGKNDSFTYSHHIKFVQKGEKIVKKRGITAREYIEMLEQVDSNKRRVYINKQCFIYENQYIIVESFDNIDPPLSLMRVETTKEGQKIKIPPFLPVVREVTEDDKYETWAIASLDYQIPQSDIEQIQASITQRRKGELGIQKQNSNIKEEAKQ